MDSSRVAPVRTALLGGVAFAVLWFVGASLLFYAAGGTNDSGPVAAAADYPDAVLSHAFNVRLGATLLVAAAVALLWFASALRIRVRAVGGIGLMPLLGAAGVAAAVVAQAGLVVASIAVAEQRPDAAWVVYQMSEAVGFESFVATVFAGVAVTGVVLTAERSTMSGWFWWVTAAIGVALLVGGVLDGLGVIPGGRFSILFSLWIFIAGFALQAGTRPSVTHGVGLS